MYFITFITKKGKKKNKKKPQKYPKQPTFHRQIPFTFLEIAHGLKLFQSFIFNNPFLEIHTHNSSSFMLDNPFWKYTNQKNQKIYSIFKFTAQNMVKQYILRAVSCLIFYCFFFRRHSSRHQVQLKYTGKKAHQKKVKRRRKRGKNWTNVREQRDWTEVGE